MDKETLMNGRATNSLLGMPIYTLDSARCLGTVKDVVYDSQNSKLVAFTLEEPGFFSPDRRVLLFEDVKSIGRDAIIIENPNVLRRADRMPQITRAVERKQSMKGKTVMTESGNKLGAISDTLIDERTGQAVSYEVSHGVAGDIGSGRNYVSALHARTVGVDAIIVPDTVESTFEEQAPGGVVGAYQAAGARAGDYSRQVSQMSQKKKIELSRGQTAGFDVRDDDGFLIVAKGEVITDSEIQMAIERGKLNQLAMAAGAGAARAGAAGPAGQAGTAWDQTKRGFSDAWANLTDSMSKSADDAGRRRAVADQKKFLKGKVSDSDIKDDQGNVLLQSGEVFTPLVLDTLDRTGQLEQAKVKAEEPVSVAKVEPQLHLIMETEEQHKREQMRPHI